MRSQLAEISSHVSAILVLNLPKEGLAFAMLRSAKLAVMQRRGNGSIWPDSNAQSISPEVVTTRSFKVLLSAENAYRSTMPPT